jgi:DnaK suppressor protein
MDKKRREKYRKRLQQERQAIMRSIENRRCAETDLELNGNIDEGDIAFNSHEKDIVFALQDSDSVRLKAVEDALDRLEEQEWGVCSHCNAPIPASRLNAVPWTTLCVRCQNQVEIYLREEGIKL